MLILSVEVSGYKRLALSRINYLRLTPHSKIQLVLGTNGSGKSSLMKELSPLPASPADYHKGGYKIFECSHKNNHYLLKSLFNANGNRYHFIKNGIDLLGDGGNATIFKDLVYQEFGLTTDIHEMVSGVVRFTEMDVAKRRNWFTRFSDADYTYAIKYYNKLTTAHRDLIGGIKLDQARLVQESEKILKPEEEQQYREEIRVLNEMLVYFLEQKSPTTVLKDDVLRDINEIDKKLEVSTRSVLSTWKDFLKRNVKFNSPEDLENETIQVQSDIQFIQHQINTICEQIEQQQKTLDALRTTNVKSLSEADVFLDKVTIDIQKKYEGLFFKELKFEDNQQALNSLLSIYEHLTEVLLIIEENHDKKYSREIYEKNVDEINRLSSWINEMAKKDASLVVSIKEQEHLRDHSLTECPECHHKWYKGYNENLYRVYLSEREDISRATVKFTKRLQELQEEQERIRIYLDLYRSYTLITRSTEVLTPFWTYLHDESILFNNPKQVIRLMENLKQDLQIHLSIEELKDKQAESIELKVLLSRSQEMNLVQLQQKHDELEKQLYDLNKKLQAKRQRLIEIKNFKSIDNSLTEHRKAIDEHLSTRNEKLESLYKLFKHEALNTCIQATQKELTKREHIVSRINVHKALVEKLQIQIEEQIKEAKLLEIAINELSPKEGLIAKGLTGFINHFVAQMNSFIKKVWLYPLELIPIAPNEEDDLELDYKFEVKVNDDNIIPDVSRTSSGMKEIIDLAYRIVSMQYLGLEDFPIILDELGSKLDHAHRESVHYVITNLLTSANFSQIYMVSHYEAAYGSLVNTDILVLSDTNINLSKNTVYNKHAVIQ